MFAKTDAAKGGDNSRITDLFFPGFQQVDIIPKGIPGVFEYSTVKIMPDLRFAGMVGIILVDQ